MAMPALEHLMGTYLHQDDDLFGPTPRAATEQFLVDEPDLALILPAEIDELLTGSSEEQIAEVLRALGCQLPPWAGDGTFRTSLSELASSARRFAQ